MFHENVSTNKKKIYLDDGCKTSVPQSSFDMAIKSFANGIAQEDILFYIDTTFSKADEGMIITADSIYYKNDSVKSKGKIDLLKLDYVRTERKFFGNTVDLRDTDGNTYHLGQVASLKEQLEALEKAFDMLINKIKRIRNL